VVPEGVLKSFFNSDVEISLDGVENAPRAKPATLYGVLLVSPKAGFEEIKSAYKRMARLTHPDVNHEPDADEQFKTIKRAWDVLGDAVMRCRYDAGLALEASLAKTQRRQTGQKFYDLLAANYGHQNFRSPLRCGLLTIDGERRLGRIHVSRIHAWDDITDAQGRVMVSSWNMDTQTYEVRWA
jgi:curved DNA-binding protein CbpA